MIARYKTGRLAAMDAARASILTALDAACAARDAARRAALTPTAHEAIDDAHRYTIAGLKGQWRALENAELVATNGQGTAS